MANFKENTTTSRELSSRQKEKEKTQKAFNFME